ncbi:MAG: ribonuclease H [Bacteroidales bacterium 45-6]|nr:MAG: ribonuclease H [Bacteroidales bacterium 45-6]
MSKKKNFYVVWNGVVPGVYDEWRDCKHQIDGYEGALYKSFPNRDAAQEAFNDNPWKHIGKNAEKPKPKTSISNPNIITESIAVDAACSGNPGLMEYRGVYVRTGEEIFHQGPFEQGTNNIGEFLALVHGMAFLKQKDRTLPIYSDSVNAIKWIRGGKCKTKLEQTSQNKVIFDLIARAEKWLAANGIPFHIIKWETDQWGEIPADFGRK